MDAFENSLALSTRCSDLTAAALSKRKKGEPQTRKIGSTAVCRNEPSCHDAIGEEGKGKEKLDIRT